MNASKSPYNGANFLVRFILLLDGRIETVKPVQRIGIPDRMP
jgi:hypothetical protein